MGFSSKGKWFFLKWCLGSVNEPIFVRLCLVGLVSFYRFWYSVGSRIIALVSSNPSQFSLYVVDVSFALCRSALIAEAWWKYFEDSSKLNPNFHTHAGKFKPCQRDTTHCNVYVQAKLVIYNTNASDMKVCIKMKLHSHIVLHST